MAASGDGRERRPEPPPDRRQATAAGQPRLRRIALPRQPSSLDPATLATADATIAAFRQAHGEHAERVRRARAWWGESVTEPLLGTSSSQEKTGLTEFGYERALAHADIAFVALEFGTYAPPRGAAVLRADHWLWQHGDPRSPEAAPIRNALRDHFFPPFDDWKEMVLFRSDQVYRQALAGLNEA